MKKPKLTDQQRNICQWHRDRAIKHWLDGHWDAYARHIRIADSITRKG